MLLLREEFISANRKPKGLFYQPAGKPIAAAAAVAREAILHRNYSSAVIGRSYSNLSEIAKKIFATIESLSHSVDFESAARHPSFDHEAGRDYLEVIEIFQQDQNFLDLETNAARIIELIPHFDTFNEKPVPENIEHDALPGGVIIIQAQALSGTGIYCEGDLSEQQVAPYYDEIRHWSFDDNKFKNVFPSIRPHFVAPGDIVIMRQGDWPVGYPPSIHTSPICNIEERDRPAQVAFGFAKPVFN